ncbi:MAG: iron-sulfur cluster assembly scaffold protein [Candidatus Lokiarchaeota archaeon]|nr:iron-sulfur cluster assembly scaffold protein [Candidatus Lokiarchaeota archaeon]
MSNKEFDRFIEELQKEIIAKEIEEFNEYIVELFHNPKNWGKLEEHNLSVKNNYKGKCGESIKYFIKIEENIIKDITFITDGCGALVAAGSQTTIMARGKPLEDIESLKTIHIDQSLKGLPKDHKHCAELAINALKDTIKKYKKNISKVNSL